MDIVLELKLLEEVEAVVVIVVEVVEDVMIKDLVKEDVLIVEKMVTGLEIVQMKLGEISVLIVEELDI